MTQAAAIKKVSLFSSLDDEAAAKLAQLLLTEQAGKGSVIFKQGELGDALHIVESGRLRASAIDAPGHQRVVALYGPGDFFGEMALLSGQPHSTAVVALEDSTLLVLKKADFERYLAGDVDAVRYMLKAVSERQAQDKVLAAAENADGTGIATGKVITLYGPKGGVGRTTMAVNLATALRKATGRQVALVDGSLSFGDVGVLLNLVADRSLADLVPQINALDSQVLDSTLYYHPSGIRVLLAPPGPEQAGTVTGDHIHMVLNRLRDQYDYTVVDTSSALDDSNLSILDASDLVLVLTTLEMAALKNVKVFLDQAADLGRSLDKMALVINRSDSTGGIRLEDVEATVGRKFVAGIVSDGRLTTDAGNRGVPFVTVDKESQITLDLIDLAKFAISVLDGQSLEGQSSGKRKVSFGTRFKRRASALVSFKLQSLFFGLGAMFGWSIVLLFASMLFSYVAQRYNVAYPTTLVGATLLWLSAFIGAFSASRIDDQHKHSWAFGLALGLLYGILIAMVTAAVADLMGDTSSIIWPVILSAIPAYGLLGLAGGLAGGVRRRRLKR